MKTLHSQHPFVIPAQNPQKKNLADWKKYVGKGGEKSVKKESVALDHDKILYGA